MSPALEMFGQLIDFQSFVALACPLPAGLAH
jgi:hypothetical protein